MNNERQENLVNLIKKIENLSDGQLFWLDKTICQLSCSRTFWRNNESDIVSDCVSEFFGEALLLHHCLSIEPFSKDKFEYVLESSLNSCGITAKLAPKG